MQENEFFGSPKFTDNELLFIQKLKEKNDLHIFRYAKIDFLFWYQFMNHIDDILLKFTQYFDQFTVKPLQKHTNQSQFDIDPVPSDQAQCLDKDTLEKQRHLKLQMNGHQMVQALDLMQIVLVTLFDIINCERCTNIGYFSVCDRILALLKQMFLLKIIGIEKYTTTIVDLLDSLIVFCASSKSNLLYGYNEINIGALILGILIPFSKTFYGLSRQILIADSPEKQAILSQQKIESHLACGFITLPFLEYSISHAYDLSGTLIQLYMNYGLPTSLELGTQNSTQFEESVPPQQTFETLTEILQSNVLDKRIKIVTINVMHKLIQLDMVARFGYSQAKSNPYFNEAIKYSSLYTEIFNQLSTYHCTLKPSYRTNEQIDPFEQSLNKKYFQYQETDRVISVSNDTWIESQNFLNDFINFLSNIAKVRLKHVNSAIFPQITGQIIKIISQPYDIENQCYPINLNVQGVACRLLTDSLRGIQTFDDSEQLNMLIQKLRQEITIIKIQSQTQVVHKLDGFYFGESEHEGYLRLYEKSWPNDDDYLCKYQTLVQRLLLIKQLLRLLCICIRRNDPNLVSYNQNYVPHSRKILESSVVQDDILTNIFKIHETLRSQEDLAYRSQVETTVSSLIIPCIQLITQVFNDLPSKIGTFSQNGLFHSVISSLTNGGIPTAPNMLLILGQFMQMLTLNSDTKQLLASSELVSMFFRMCTDPKKYYKFITSRRRDDIQLEQVILAVANSNEIICDKIFKEFFEISNLIIQKSGELTRDYISMDQNLKFLDQKLFPFKSQYIYSAQFEEMSEQIEKEKNEIRQNYLQKQLSLENMFDSFYLQFFSLFDNERYENSVGGISFSDPVNIWIAKNKDEVIQLIYRSSQNPVLASALHQYSEEYTSLVIALLNIIKAHQQQQAPAIVQNAPQTFMNKIFTNLKIQIENLKQILIQDGSTLHEQGFKDFSDIESQKTFKMNMVEQPEYYENFPELKQFAEEINGDSGISPQDQIAIILRKIFLYCETIMYWLQSLRDPKKKYFEFIKLFETQINLSLPEIARDLFQLSTLITKNRAVNYAKTVFEENQKLEKYYQQFTEEKIKQENEQMRASSAEGSAQSPVTNELQAAARLYEKYERQKGSDTLTKHIHELADTASVMNFKCDDSICTNGQACQIQAKRLLKWLPLSIRGRKAPGPKLQTWQPTNETMIQTSLALGQEQLAECIDFIQAAENFIQRFSRSENSNFEIHFDQILFNLISGLYQTNKIICNGNLPGSFVYSFANAVLDSKFLIRLIRVSVLLADFIEAILRKGIKIPFFRLAYIKVLWKNVHSLIQTLLDTNFCPSNDSDKMEFLIEFDRCYSFQNQEFTDFINRLRDGNKLEMNRAVIQIAERGRCNLQSLLRRIFLQIGQAFYQQQLNRELICEDLVNSSGEYLNIFYFMSKYTQKCCMSQLSQFLLNHLTNDFSKLQLNKKMGNSINASQRQLSNLDNYLNRIRPSLMHPLLDLHQLNPLNLAPHRRAIQEVLAQQENAEQRHPPQPPESRASSSQDSSFSESIDEDLQLIPGQDMLHMGNFGLNDRFQVFIGAGDQQGINLNNQNIMQISNQSQIKDELSTEESCLFKELIEKLNQQQEKIQEIQTKEQLIKILQTQITDSNKLILHSLFKKSEILLAKTFEEHEHYENVCKLLSAEEKQSHEKMGKELKQIISQLIDTQLKNEIDQITPQTIPNFKATIHQLLVSSLSMLIQDKPIYGNYYWDKQKNEVYGINLRLDLSYALISKLLKQAGVHEGLSFIGSKNNKNEIFENQDHFKFLKEKIEQIFVDFLDQKSNYLQRANLMDVNQLRQVVMGIFTFRKYSQVYSNEWNQPRKQLSLFSNILKKATKALQKCFNRIPELQKSILTLKAQTNAIKKDCAQYQEKMKSFEEQEAVIDREQNEISNIRLPLLNTLLMIAEEQLTALLSPSLLDAKVNEIVQVAESIRDTPEMDQARVTPPSEEAVKAKIQCLEKFQQSLLNIFKDQQDIFKDDTSGKPKQAIIKDTLESLLKQQIELLKVYGNTPIEACSTAENKIKNQESDLKTFVPVVLAIRLLKIIISLGDQLLKLDNKHIKPVVKPGQQSKPVNQQLFLCPLRRLFMQNDGLRHVFLIKVQELYCYQPDQFISKKVQGFINFRLQYEGVVDELVATLGSTPSSYIRIFESQIKQLMFVQFKQNFYKENKKEALEVFKNLLQITASKDQTIEQTEIQQNQQKGLQTKQKESKKQKQKTENTQEGQAAHSKHQQKQIKILLRKHENQSEVPLRQFIEFFILSKLLQPNIEDELGLFLTACKNMCLINVVDSQESDCQKIVTIKLKTNVLKEVILDGIQLNNQVSQKSKNSKVIQNNSDTWNSQFQKQVGEVQFQHEIVTQLLDLFIFQNKGHKMSYLKQLKAGKLNPTSNQIDEYQVKLIQNQIYIKPLEQTVFEENEIVASEKCEYLFDSQQILQNISIETSKSPILVGSVLSHQQQKTFKYIVRNCISLKLLQLIPEEIKPKTQLLKPDQVVEAAFKKIGGQKIVFKENEKVLDTRIHNFFRTMLFDRHTVSASKKIFRLEARNVFIQEMTKNLITHQQISCQDENNKDQLLSVKLIQNYNSILLIHHILFAPDSKTDKLAEKWKAINQKIRRYNKTQQWNIMLRIIFEIQRNCTINLKDGIESLGIFKILKRIRDELTSPTLNPFIEFKARAIAICNSLVIKISKDLIKDNEKNLIKQINMAMIPSKDKVEEKGEDVEPTKKRVKLRRWKQQQGDGLVLDDGSMLRSEEDEFIEDEGDEQEEEEYDEEFEEDMDDTFIEEEGEEEHDEEDDDILLEQAVQNNLEMEQDFEEGEAEMEEDEVNDNPVEAGRQRVIRLLDIQMQAEQSEDEDQNSGPPSEDGSQDQIEDEDMFEEYNGDDPDDEDGLDDIDRSEDEEDEDSLIPGSYDENGQEFNDDEDAYSIADGVWPQGNAYTGEGAGENDLFDQNVRRVPEQHSDYQTSQNSFCSTKQDQLYEFSVAMLGTQEEVEFLANFGIGRTSYRFMTDIYRNSLPLFASRLSIQPERTSTQSNWHQNVRAMWWNNSDMQQQTSATSDALLAQAQKILSGESKGEDEKQFLQWIIKRQFSFEKILCKVKGGSESDLQALQKMKEDQQNQVTDFETIALKLESTLQDLCTFSQNRQFCLAFQSQLLASIVALYDIISLQIGTDQNLFVCSIATDCDELKALQLSLVDKPSIKIQILQPQPVQDEQFPVKNLQELKQKQDEQITLNHLVGYNEFLIALKVLNGDIIEEEDKGQIRENKEGQIDSSTKIVGQTGPPGQKFSTLDQLDPLFTQALNEPSISSIIENDRRIHQMQKLGDQTQLKLPQVQHINEFIKKQTGQIRQQVLKSLDQHFLQYLTSDLYAEAKKLRPNIQPHQERTAAQQLRGRQNNNPNPGGLRQRGNLLQVNQNQVRERLLSMDVYQSRPVLEIENVNNRRQNNQEGEESKAISVLRDSESEDINIQAGNRYNLNQDAFCSNLHEFMTQNIENYKIMPIKSYLKQEWIQSRKLSKNKCKQIDTNRDLEVFIEEILINQFIPSTCDGVQDFAESAKRLQDLIDLALSEIMTSKAILSMEEINSTNHFKRLSFLMQLPHFRLILQVKLVDLMQSNVEFMKQKIQNNQKIEEGQLLIWESEFDVKPKELSPKLALSFLIKYIYEIQTSTCSRSGKKGILDLLKLPSQDPFFKSLVHDDGDRTLLDRMLVAINQYIQILNENPLSFDLKENSQKEFSRWKKEVLQLILLLLEQFYLSTSAIIRRLPQSGTSTYQLTHSFSMFTLQQLFKILFFSSKDQIDSDALNVDNSQSSVSQIIKVLNRISSLKIESSIQVDLNENTNLLSFKKNSAKKEEEDESNVISASDLVRQEMKKLININLEHFHDLFDYKLSIVHQSQYSVLSAGQQKVEKKRTFQVVSKIQHIFKIALSLSCIRNTKVDSGLLFDQVQLCKLLSVVQRIIDHEKNIKKNQVNQRQNETQVGENSQNNNQNRDQDMDGQNQELSSILHWQFLLQEEFKLILNLVLTLAYQQLKQTKLSETASIKLGAQSDVNQQPEQDEQNREIRGRRQRANQKKKQTEVQVLFETAEEIKNQKQRDDQFLTENPVYHYFEDNAQTHQLLDFIMLNKELLNVYIQKSHSNQQNAQLTSLLDLVIMVPQILEFSSKRILWRQCIKKQLKKSGRDEEYEIEVQVRRGQVFSDSFEQLKDVQIDSWKQKFSIEFHDEEGVDEGGLTKEWFQLVSQGIFDPNYALFQQSAQGSTYFPSPKSVVHEKEELVQLFVFVGRIIGKALCEGHLLDCYFVKALYKMMLGQKLELSDLEDFDPQVYKSLQYMLTNDAETLCQSFLLSSKFFDEQKNIELKPGGSEIEVTNENKFEYCQLVLEYLLYGCVRSQIDSILKGFRDLVPQNLVQMFDYKELELMLSGMPVIDIQDLKENVIYRNFTRHTPVIIWLWEILEEFKNSERAEFIQFVTATSKVPVEGFKGLRGSSGQNVKVEIIKLTCDQPDQRLPQAHTCFFQLDLPEYSSKQILRQKLLFAIKEGKTFNIA